MQDIASIRFAFKGKKYQVNRSQNSSYRKPYIVLDDGTVLKIHEWKELCPELMEADGCGLVPLPFYTPTGITEVPLHLFRHEPLQSILEIFNAVLATEV